MTQDTLKTLTKEFVTMLHRFKRMQFGKKDIRNMRPSEFFVLMNLRLLTETEPGGVKVSSLSSFHHVTPAGITHIVDSLVKNDFVERLNNPNDRRIVLIRPTIKGNRFIDELDKKMMKRMEELFLFLGENDGKEFIRLLALVIGFFEKSRSDADVSEKSGH